MQDNFSLDDLLAQTNLDKVTAEGTGYDELPTGYYLCSVNNAELGTSKSSGLPMVTFTLDVITDGIVEYTDEEGTVTLGRAPKTKGRKIFKYYPLFDSKGDIEKSKKNVQALFSDLKKFEDPSNPGESMLKDILEDENGNNIQLNTEILTGCLDVIKELTIYVHQTVTDSTKNPGEKNVFKTLISWNRVEKLGLLEVPELED